MVTIPTRLVRNRLDGPRHQKVASGPNSGRYSLCDVTATVDISADSIPSKPIPLRRSTLSRSSGVRDAVCCHAARRELGPLLSVASDRQARRAVMIDQGGDETRLDCRRNEALEVRDACAVTGTRRAHRLSNGGESPVEHSAVW